jgi:hypothetical protein
MLQCVQGAFPSNLPLVHTKLTCAGLVRPLHSTKSRSSFSRVPQVLEACCFQDADLQQLWDLLQQHATYEAEPSINYDAFMQVGR